MTSTGPDSGMASGSDAGRPGEHGDRRPLDDDERRLLAELDDAGGGPAGQQPPEETPAAGRAADDEAPLPTGEGGAQDDGLSPRFTPPPG
ncbi:hypothetical protein OF117_19460 [Geodermatophilus sp. YIM 151500]|uniref:hypothetical protein n=1 Tax=Geodermatophilus sp. YIM 151500 TaxID=2984531 RepID=UPI0021E42404|nr:hypothetical protein [Geodermatophilus sp. YIM 151500]MCV2491528.1 hypothetical protein [Geodermatophilus sp. YIM 151500]